MHRLLCTFLLALFLTAAGAPVAHAVSASDRLHDDCQDERIDGTYTQQQYAAGLRTIGTDLDEYTTCRDVIRAAQLAAAGGPSSSGRTGSPAGSAPGGEGSGGVGGASPSSPARVGGTAAELLGSATPAEREAVAKVRDRRGAPSGAVIGGRMIAPTAAVHAVPAPLVVVLVLLAGSLVAAGAHAVRSRLRRRVTA